MGLRFRKRLRLMPGVHLNISKSGISTSIGRPGLTVNIRKGRARATVGLPGTGLSYSEEIRRSTGTRPPPARGSTRLPWLVLGCSLIVLLLLITLTLTSTGVRA